MAAGLGFIEFTTGDVLTAADANGYLASQVVMVFADAADRTADLTSPEEGMIAYLKDTNAVEKYDGAAWVSVGGGGGGKVLQVVNATTTTPVTVASATPTDSGLTASITPTLNTSKILVIYNQSLYVERGTVGVAGAVRLLRAGTLIQDLGYVLSINVSAATFVQTKSNQGASFLDSPATTSATTYKTQINVNTTANTGTSTAQQNNCMSSITLIEIGV